MKDKRIIVTGAAGGIASRLAIQLADAGARLCLTDINAGAIRSLTEIPQLADAVGVAGDITNAADRQRIVSLARQSMGGIDMLINAAGINPFGVYAEQDEKAVRNTLNINLLGPMLLTRAVLPTMLDQGRGQIVNIGSTFGSIGFAWFTAYSASKFGLRGFSQALRRELSGSGIGVSYIAPRAVRTSINSSSVYAMAEAVNMNMDTPERVADAIMASLRRLDKERYIGFPEALFVRINALVPGLVDWATRKQNSVARKYAEHRDAHPAG